MESRSRWTIVVLALIFMTTVAFAQDVVEDTGKAKVNWTKKQLVFTGDGAVNLKAPNAASARIGAERAAQLAALRNALESLKGVKIDSGMTVGDKLKAEPSITAKVEGVLRGFIVAETRYYSDGGVQRDLIIPLDGQLTRAIMKPEATPPVEAPVEKKQAEEPKPAPAEQAVAEKVDEEKPITGLVVVAKGFKLIPVLAPKIIDDAGKDIYDVSMVSDEGIDNGIASYITNEAEALKHEKAGGNPLVIKAIKSPNSVDLVLSKDDAAKVRKVAKASSFLADGKVIIVKD